MTLTELFARGDGAHWGLTDLYPNKEKALIKALRAGRPFDTGWYSSKKEIASARIASPDGNLVNVEVSVSDDFDTEGRGQAGTLAKLGIDEVRKAIDRAWEDANLDQKANRQYAGFSIHNKAGYWIETLILPAGDYGLYLDRPPGDNYHAWGFQGDEEISLEDREKMRAWADRYMAGNTQEKSFTSGKFTIKPWSD